MTSLQNITQKLLFMIGKGGVGRTTVAASLASFFVSRGEKVLVVQWSLNDAISNLYSLPACGHKETTLPAGYKVMNFVSSEAIREYFVDHLNMRLLHSLVIENKHVQKLLNAAPGVQELFFLGRLFWLVELAEQERGYHYDRILVDTPATGHGVSLFGIAPAIAQFGITGPLATECERVAKLLGDASKTGVFFVTLPEELPVQETMETLPQIAKQLGRFPLAILLNQSICGSLFKNLEDFSQSKWFYVLYQRLEHDSQCQLELKLIFSALQKRKECEEQLRIWSAEQGSLLPVISLPDVHFLSHRVTPLSVVNFLTEYMTDMM